MGRIADAALELLADGPADHRALGSALSERGVTRARDPAGAVRRALRDDARTVELVDGRVASLAQALDGVTLTATVGAAAIDEGSLPLDPDLAPLALAAVGPRVPLPDGARPGWAVAVRFDGGTGVVAVRPQRRLVRRPADEAALMTAVRRRFGTAAGPEPLVSLAAAVVDVTAASPSALRVPGMPLSDVLGRAGYEVHLGWIGHVGTRWDAVVEAHAEALEDRASGLLGDGRVEPSAAVQADLVRLLERAGSARASSARRRLARTLGRADRPGAGIRLLRAAFDECDPEDRYAAAVLAHRMGEAVTARRWVEEGLARADGSSEAAAALADLGSDLDEQAAYARLSAALEGTDGDPVVLARAIAGPRRSYLVEAMVEATVGELDEHEAIDAVAALATSAGEVGRDAALACAAVLRGPVAAVAWETLGVGAVARRPAVAGLVEAHPSAAWVTSLDDAPGQQQLIIAVAKEEGRVAPLVALIDAAELNGAARDAFFIPDMVPVRLEREVLGPMEEIGLRPRPLVVHTAVEQLSAALGAARMLGWRLPSLDGQPVLERARRWVLDRTQRDG